MSIENPPLRVIYIGGIEHNGSTLLGLALGNHPQIVCVGELSQLPRQGWAGTHLCACGQQITNCPFWNNVLESWSQLTQDDFYDLIAAERVFDRNLSLPRLFFERYWQSSSFKKYTKHTQALFEAIQHTSGKSIIVDTSKRVSRALALSRMEEVDLKLIHLVRDARGVAYSSGKPKRAIRSQWWKSAARWRYINGSFQVIKRMLDKENEMLVRYEDFIQDPDNIVAEIGRFIDVDLTNVANLLTSGGKLSSGHIGIGNGFLQGSQEIILRRTIDWPQKMPKKEQRNVWRLTAGSMRRYGYQEKVGDLKKI